MTDHLQAFYIDDQVDLCNRLFSSKIKDRPRIYDGLKTRILAIEVNHLILEIHVFDWWFQRAKPTSYDIVSAWIEHCPVLSNINTYTAHYTRYFENEPDRDQKIIQGEFKAEQADVIINGKLYRT